MTLDYLDHLKRDAARFADVLRDVDSQARVPSCPDWSADDLLWHLGEVFHFWGTIVRLRLADPDAVEGTTPQRPADVAGLLAFYAETSGALIDGLAATDDDVPVWSWSTDHSVGFVRRRMAHEALIHRMDAELTAGVRPELDANLATDGVQEALEHLYGGWPEWADYRPDGPLGSLSTSDTGAQWLVRLGSFSGLSPNTGKTYDGEPTLELVGSGEPTFTVRAAAADLDAWIWNRPTTGALPAAAGDLADFDRFRAIIAKGVE